MLSFELCAICENTFSYRTPPAADSAFFLLKKYTCILNFFPEWELLTSVCISRPPALALTLCLAPQFVFTGSGTQFVFTDPGPQFAFTGSGSQCVFIGPGLQFYYQSGAWVCIYQPGALNLYLQPWPTICITVPEPEFAFTLLLVVVAVVAVTVVVVISLEQIMPIFVCRF